MTYTPETTIEREARDLDRYRDVLARSLPKFSVGEACLLCDICNGWFVTTASYCLIWMEVEDGIELDGLDEKWEVDSPGFVDRLKALTPAENIAVIDAIERWFEGTPHNDYETSLRQVGLVE
jgi:hypothetical protein